MQSAHAVSTGRTAFAVTAQGVFVQEGIGPGRRSFWMSSASAASMAARSSSLGCGVISRSISTQANVLVDRGRSKGRVGRRLLIAAVVLALVPTSAAAASPQGAGAPARSWAANEIRTVTAAGLMGTTSAAGFRPQDAHRPGRDLASAWKQTVFLPDLTPVLAPVSPRTEPDCAARVDDARHHRPTMTTAPTTTTVPTPRAVPAPPPTSGASRTRRRR